MAIRANDIKVTVTMPAYNASKYIEAAIESVLSQDYDDFELLIMDDGSTDSILDIVRRYRKYSKVRIFKNKDNLGVGKTRNRLIELSCGRYISPCDADDIMLPGNLKTFSKFLDKHPKVGAVYGNLLALEINKKGVMTDYYIISSDCSRKWDLLEKYSIICHPGSMIRKDLIIKAGGYGENFYCMDDASLWSRLSDITSIRHLNDGVHYVWRRHPNSLTKTCLRERSSSDRIAIEKEAIKRRYGFNFKL